jgi:alpha-tubulin suppressor-like RCC1 family protein
VTCVIADTGEVLCWGWNSTGQLGDGSAPSSRSTPGPVTGLSDVVSLAAGCHQHLCAVDGSGAVYCWGENVQSQLGDGTTTSSDVPVRVAFPEGDVHVVEVAVGSAHTCARTDDGRVWCWGANDEGQIGNGTVGEPRGPTLVPRFAAPGAIPAAALQLGCDDSCVRLTDGSFWCWGGNEGIFADASVERAPQPRQVNVACEGS